jgi:uncharacterized protein YcnI
MSSINATAGSPTQPTALIKSADNTSTLTFQTNSTAALNINSSQNANCTSTGAVTIPAGTIAQRPTGVAGMIRYNTSNNVLETYINGAWTTFP